MQHTLRLHTGPIVSIAAHGDLAATCALLVRPGGGGGGPRDGGGGGAGGGRVQWDPTVRLIDLRMMRPRAPLTFGAGNAALAPVALAFLPVNAYSSTLIAAAPRAAQLLLCEASGDGSDTMYAPLPDGGADPIAEGAMAASTTGELLALGTAAGAVAVWAPRARPIPRATHATRAPRVPRLGGVAGVRLRAHERGAAAAASASAAAASGVSSRQQQPQQPPTYQQQVRGGVGGPHSSGVALPSGSGVAAAERGVMPSIASRFALTRSRVEPATLAARPTGAEARATARARQAADLASGIDLTGGARLGDDNVLGARWPPRARRGGDSEPLASSFAGAPRAAAARTRAPHAERAITPVLLSKVIDKIGRCCGAISTCQLACVLGEVR